MWERAVALFRGNPAFAASLQASVPTLERGGTSARASLVQKVNLGKYYVPLDRPKHYPRVSVFPLAVPVRQPGAPRFLYTTSLLRHSPLDRRAPPGTRPVTTFSASECERLHGYGGVYSNRCVTKATVTASSAAWIKRFSRTGTIPSSFPVGRNSQSYFLKSNIPLPTTFPIPPKQLRPIRHHSVPNVSSLPRKRFHNHSNND